MKRKSTTNNRSSQKILILLPILVVVVVVLKLVIGSSNSNKTVELLSDRFDIDVESLSVSTIKGIDGFYEVVLKTSHEVFYSDKNAEYIILGRLIDKDGNDVTLVKEQELEKGNVEQLLSDIDYSKAVVIGTGDIKVIEFTDVECPYCLKAEGFFDDSIVTRYVFFSPLNSNNITSREKSVHILCSDNKATAYKDIISGTVTKLDSCEKGKLLLDEHLKYSKSASVRGTPHFIFPQDHSTIIGADPKILDKIKSLGGKS